MYLMLMQIAAAVIAASALSPPQPISPGTWVSPDDYPADAFRKGEQGIGYFDVVVDAEGKPISCKVISSTKSPSLDDTSCRLMTAHRRYLPAHDDNGTSIGGVFSRRLVWTLPNAPIRNPNGWVPPSDIVLTLKALPKGATTLRATLIYLVSTSGSVDKCEPSQSTGLTALDNAACKATAGEFFDPVLDRDGNPMRTIRSRTVDFTAEGTP